VGVAVVDAAVRVAVVRLGSGLSCGALRGASAVWGGIARAAEVAAAAGATATLSRSAAIAIFGGAGSRAGRSRLFIGG